MGENRPSQIFQALTSVVADGETTMNESNLLQSLGQVSVGEASEIFRDHLRGCVREMICEVMAAEVAALCGPKHAPTSGDVFRSGNSSGRVIFEGQREDVVRPRVRQRQADGSTTEVPLASYESARDPERLQASIIAALMCGVSTREIKQVQPDPQGTSKSSVSRHWRQAGHKFVEQLRGRDLSTFDWTVLMLDGIRLSKDQLAIAAIGITADGHKHVLDFDLGSSENAEVCRGLMRRLMKRGFHCERRLLAVLDGSDALRSVVKEFFADSVIQRCLVHKERNIRAKLSKRHWGELARLFKRLRSVQGKQAAEEVVAELEAFLKPLNAEALKSLHEAGDDLIALQSLNVPNTLHRNLLSTNAIENSFLNTRRKLGRVTRFRAETDQATRWLAFALTEVEQGFRRISGHDDLPRLVAALAREGDPTTRGTPIDPAVPLPSPTAPSKAPPEKLNI
jgi:putative transposase